MDTYRVPTEPTRKAIEEERKRIEAEEAAVLAAAEAERKKKALLIPKSHTYTELEWKKQKSRRKMANKSRRKNR